MKFNQQETERLYTITPEEQSHKPENIGEIRQSLKDKVYDMPALMERITQEEDLKEYVPLVTAIFKEFLEKGKLEKLKAAFEKMALHKHELHVVVGWAMEEYTTKKSLNALRLADEKKIEQIYETGPSMPSKLKQKKVQVDNPIVPPPPFSSSAKK